MKTIQIDLPADLDSELAALGVKDAVAVAGWVTDAIREKLSAAKQFAYLQARAARGNENRFRDVLARVPAIDPAPEDRLR